MPHVCTLQIAQVVPKRALTGCVLSSSSRLNIDENVLQMFELSIFPPLVGVVLLLADLDGVVGAPERNGN